MERGGFRRFQEASKEDSESSKIRGPRRLDWHEIDLIYSHLERSVKS
jgi:hypothetical protein